MLAKSQKFLPAERHLTLSNGLRVHLLPRPDFHQVVAMVTVDYGARDRLFMDQGKLISQPAGVAHFVEHCLFAQPDYDAFSRLSELGANANAFTTQTRTSYYLSTTVGNQAALQELLTFTQEPYFDLATVQREQEIITQEIDMYEDDINSKLYRLILARLYPNDPLGQDIAGTVESVHQITPEQLQLAFSSFYQPDNMDVVVTGAFDETKLLSLIENSPAGQRVAAKSVTKLVPDLNPVITTPLEVPLNVVRNKVVLGQRWELDFAKLSRRDILRVTIIGSLAIDLVFGEFSPTYMTWYNDGLIDDNFSADFDAERHFAYLTIAAETAEPERVIAAVSQVLNDLTAQVSQLTTSFNLVKNDALSRLINKLNQLEETAIRFEGQTFDEATLQDEIAILQALTVNDMITVLTQTAVSPVASIIARPDML